MRTPTIVAAAGAGLAALTIGGVLLLTGTATATNPAGTNGPVITSPVPADAPAQEPDGPEPTATVQSGDPVPQDPNAPVVVTSYADTDAVVGIGDAPQPTGTVTSG